MHVLHVRNVHEGLALGLDLIRRHGVQRDSRNGPVLQIPDPVTTVYAQPLERVEFWGARNSNPFFHFIEKLWMLAGRRDVRPLTRYVKRMESFSDDGQAFNAAYGYRWRNARRTVGVEHYPHTTDQLVLIAEQLRQNKDTRQCVLQIWDHAQDLGTQTKDHACNIAATFQVGLDGRLNMVVFCRSNDAIWGCYGANAVHFSALLEYVAFRAGLPVGTYSQIGVNLHVYTDRPDTKRCLEEITAQNTAHDNIYSVLGVQPYPMISTDPDRWDQDCRMFVTEDGSSAYGLKTLDPFWEAVAFPIVRAHDAYKALGFKKFDEARTYLKECQATDWRMACEAWIDRREQAADKRDQ